MVRDKTCSNCRFYEHADTSILECRRLPPQVYSSLTNLGGPYSTMSRTVFPAPSGLDWCGEWKKKKKEK